MTGRLRLFPRAVAAACLLAMAGCSSDESDLAPCPSARVLGEPSELTRFADGAGRDPVDVVFEASFTRVAGECTYGTGGGDIDVELTVVFDIARGPAGTDRAASFSYFVAVSERAAEGAAKPRILARESFPVEASFPAARKGLRYTDVLDITIPRGEGRGVGDYVMYLGFELSAEELSYNRRKGLR